MQERGEGNSTAIVAIFVLALLALGVFFYVGRGGRGGPPGEIKIDIEKKPEYPVPKPQ